MDASTAIDWQAITESSPPPITDVLVCTHIPGEPRAQVFFGWRRQSDPSQFVISGSETDVVPGTPYAFAPEPEAAPLPAGMGRF